MGSIEWEETEELRPHEGSVAEFCRTHGVDLSSLAPEGLLVLIEDESLAALHEFLQNETTREHGGVLIGEPFWDPKRLQYFIVIRRAYPAYHTEGSPVHLQFTPDTWNNIAVFIEDTFPGQSMAITGWYHSHPNLGVFMSGTDQNTQSAFYHHPWCVAVVVDPIRHQTGWFEGKDCLRMKTSQVATFLAHPQKELFDEQYPETYQSRPDLRALRWLLPSAFLATLIIGAAWLYLRHRLGSGVV